MLLIVDVDSNSLDGSSQARRDLRNALQSAKECKVIFSTRRGIESIVSEIDDPLAPIPDFVVADGGATVVDGELRPVQPLQTEIEQCWPGEIVVEQALKGIPGVKRQNIPHQRRCAYTFQQVSNELRKAVADLECELQISDNSQLDILPKGVTPEKTLQRLMQLEQLDQDPVYVVGGLFGEQNSSQAKSAAAVPEQARPYSALPKRLHHFRGIGAKDVLHELIQQNVVCANEVSSRQVRPAEASNAPLIMVYHRMPFAEVEIDGQTVVRPHKSPNGIIPTLLGFFSDGRAGCWVAWNEVKSRGKYAEDAAIESTIVDPERYPNMRLSRIGLTAKDVKQFYYTFSKEAFWPIIFSFPGRAVFNRSHWEHYVEINRLFAERVAAQAEQNAIVWIHDYNLWMVPGHLRELRPDVRIVFFHHTSFPSPDVFNVIPWRREIIRSLLQCDYVAFHIPSYACNFAAVVQTYAETDVRLWRKCAPRYISYGCALSVDSYPTEITTPNATVQLGVHPVGIDLARIEEILDTEETSQRISELREELQGKQVILSLERLDYVKGPTEKLKTFERLLERHPELHGKLVLVNVCTPPAPGMAVYAKTREQVDQIVGRINGRFGSVDWTPIVYLYRSLPYEEVLAYYAVSDIAWITPLRDGLNLVAKEYSAVKGIRGETGTLVLSEFAGAAVELFGAVLVNPYDEEDMLVGLDQALAMSEAEKRVRIEQLYSVVRKNDISQWAIEFMSQIDSL